MTCTPYQIELLHHTLGLRPDCREPYRNHFVAGPGHHDMRDLEALEREGLMMRGRTPAFLDNGDVVFTTTDAGRELAIASLPAPAKRSRADDWCDRDGSESFGEFLCGDRLPRVETRQSELDRETNRYRDEHRMYRFGQYPLHTRREVEGEWCSTKKAAKASYKAALKAFRARDNHGGSHHDEHRH
ncbi:hypothetical protein [Burkholderia anthina]|uniref:hypothetical protein n=1 Tax=Burkholderia anthina TaxID=179879 RepID=UPI00158C2FF8|nr:hypothetical protein [Burkholderia anthina]